MSKNIRYVQVADILREEIQRLGPNTLMPTEHQLAKRFKVSRVTIRHSLDLLERSGVISRHRGRGSIINPEKVVRNNVFEIWLEDDLRTQGISFETKVQQCEILDVVPESIRERLRLERAQDVGYVSITRLVHDNVICHEARYVAAEILEKLVVSEVETRPFYCLLSEISGKQVEFLDTQTEILPASSAVAGALKVKPGTLILVNTSTHFLSDELPIEVMIVSYRLDRCKFKAQGRIFYPYADTASGKG
jgi:GntR family transcriptional regulator